MQREASLSDKDHDAMDSMLGNVLDAYKNGNLSKQAAISGLAHVMAALDIRNTGEAVAWFNQKDLKFFKGVDNGINHIK